MNKMIIFNIYADRIENQAYHVHRLTFIPSSGDPVTITMAGPMPTYEAFLEKVHQAGLLLSDNARSRMLPAK